MHANTRTRTRIRTRFAHAPVRLSKAAFVQRRYFWWQRETTRASMHARVLKAGINRRICSFVYADGWCLCCGCISLQQHPTRYSCLEKRLTVWKTSFFFENWCLFSCVRVWACRCVRNGHVYAYNLLRISTCPLWIHCRNNGMSQRFLLVSFVCACVNTVGFKLQHVLCVFSIRYFGRSTPLARKWNCWLSHTRASRKRQTTGVDWKW